MTIAELRAWATNTIQRDERVHNPQSGFVAESDIPKSVRMIQTNIPSCRFSYADATNVYCTIEPDAAPVHSSSGSIEAVSIDWYIYGVMVGSESFNPSWEHEPWYTRKLADGVYLWHGYK
jgi:hypothetical protein